MSKRKFSKGGETEDGEDYKPRFSSDVYERAKRFVESGGQKEATDNTVKKAVKVTPPSKPTPPSEPTPAPSPANDEDRTGPTIKRATAMAQRKAGYEEMSRPGRDAIEPVYPESMLAPVGALRGLSALRKGINAAKEAETSTAATKAFQKGVEPAVGKSSTRMERERLASKRANREAAETSTASSGKPAAYKPGKTKFNQEEAGIEFKKGGGIKKYAKGGSIDGCAQRGKTRGKVV